MRIRVLSSSDLRAALPMTCAIEAMRSAFADLAAGHAHLPRRTRLETASGISLFMPAYLPQRAALLEKVVSVFPANPASGLPLIHSLVVVFDPRSGAPRALLEGATLTSIRTGAATGLATSLLARPESRRLALFGAGAQSYDQVQAVCTVRPIERVRIVSRAGRSCGRLARRLRAQGLQAESCRDPRRALEGAEVIVTATPSTAPLFRDEDLARGAHLNALGAFTPAMCEIPPATVARARVVVDDVQAALEEAGDLIQPLESGLIDRSHLSTTLGDLLLGRARGRSAAQEITLFKSVGVAVQDAAAAAAALERAEARQLGVWVDL